MFKNILGIIYSKVGGSGGGGRLREATCGIDSMLPALLNVIVILILYNNIILKIKKHIPPTAKILWIQFFFLLFHS